MFVYLNLYHDFIRLKFMDLSLPRSNKRSPQSKQGNQIGMAMERVTTALTEFYVFICKRMSFLCESHKNLSSVISIL